MARMAGRRCRAPGRRQRHRRNRASRSARRRESKRAGDRSPRSRAAATAAREPPARRGESGDQPDADAPTIACAIFTAAGRVRPARSRAAPRGTPDSRERVRTAAPCRARARRPDTNPRRARGSGQREIFPLVVRQRLIDPVDRARTPVAAPDRDDQRDATTHGRAGGHCRPSKRSAEICSETSPTRKTITASMMRSTDEFVTCCCVAIVQMA